MIQKDNTGLSVVVLQAQLRSLGFKNKRIDGKFDAMTQSAVKDFQRSQGLIIDGIVGPNTNAIIRELTKDKHLFTFIHCSATTEGRNVSAKAVLRYHTINKGWSRPGYSDIIELNAKLKYHNELKPFLCPTMGKQRIADTLCRVAGHVRCLPLVVVALWFRRPGI